MNRRVHVIVVGRVQGVCFRDYTRKKSLELGLRGWVRNLPTGDIEIRAEGPAARLSALAIWCRQGPPMAKVIDISVRWEDSLDEFDEFRVTW